jgi:hypothetical protein
MAAPTPALLATAAHGLYQWDVAPKWSTIKFNRMRGVLWAKFTQHPDLAALLLATRTARLVEAATIDNAVNRLWGEVEGKGGRNMLGTMLMEIRERLARGDNHFGSAASPSRPPSSGRRDLSVAVVGTGGYSVGEEGVAEPFVQS